MIVLLVKVTVLLALALIALRSMRRSSAALRHIVCTCAIAGTLLLPFTLFAPPEYSAFLIDPSTAFATPRILVRAADHWSLLEISLLLWASGTGVLLLQIAAGCLAPMQLRRSAAQFPCTAPIPVFFADVSVPVICGLVQPVILLPHAAEQWTSQQRNAAVQHELQHLNRGDLWTMLLARVACALYWFHPLAWIVARQSRQEQESACDDAVLAGGFEPHVYAEALLAAARQVTSTRLIGCHMLTSNGLKLRITRLFDTHLERTSTRASFRGTVLASLGVVTLIGMLAGTEHARAGQEQVYKVGNGIAAPKILSKIDPDYSPEGEAGKIQGTVILSIVIGIDGLARDIEIVRPLGSGLDEKAIEAVQKWVFQPGTKDGQPVSVRATIEINFRRV